MKVFNLSRLLDWTRLTRFHGFYLSSGLSVAVNMAMPPVDAIVIKDVVRPVRGAGFWTDRCIAKSSVSEEVRMKTLQKMAKLLKRSAHRMEKFKGDPSKYKKMSSLWSELFLLEESRQHYVEEESHYRDGRDDGGPLLAGQIGGDAWNEWTWYISVCTRAWKQAVRRERSFRIRLLKKQLELIRLGLADLDADGFTTWANGEVAMLGRDIESNFDNLDYCPEDRIVKLSELAALPVWLMTTRNMWDMEGVNYSEL